MRKILLVAGLTVLVSGCGEKGDFESDKRENITIKAVLLTAGQ